MPGPSSTTAISTRSPTRPAVTRTGLSGAYRSALSTRLASTRSSRPLSAITTASATSTLTRSSPRRRKPVTPLLIPSSARCTVSSRYTRRSSGRTTPAASRDESSRLPTSAVSWSIDSSMVASSSAVSSAEKSTSSLRRLDTAALAPASGVRRSWLTADSSERRSSSACAMASALPASSVSSRCLTSPAACLATAPSTRRSRAASFLPAINIQNSSSPTSIAVSAVSTSTQGFSPTQPTMALPSGPSRSRLTARCE